MEGRGWRLRAAMVTAVALFSLVAGLLAGTTKVSAAVAVPGAPTGVRGVPRDQGALVSWVPPSSVGGSPVTGYVITASPGGKSVHTAAVTRFLVGGLTNGTAYTFTVAAVNKDGTGPASKPSAPVTPKSPTAPGAPGSVAAVAGFEQATVSWVAPKSDGGAPVTGYQVTTIPASATVPVTGSARSAVLTGLLDGTSYTVRVAAVNSAGVGQAGVSGAVTPQVTVPGVPATVTAAPAASGVTVAWRPPVSTGGSAVSAYVINMVGTTRSVTVGGSARSATVTGLTAGTSYTFTVAAQNAQGLGASVTSAPATASATVAARTVVLSKASLATLSKVGTDGSLVFTSPTSQVRRLAVGDVIAAGVSAATPGGLLVKVTSVSVAAAKVTVTTTAASLDQALSAAGFGTTVALTGAQVTGFTAAHRGVRLQPPGKVPASAAPGSIGVSVNVDLYTDNHDEQVTVQGSLAVTPHLSFAASITCCTHTASQFTGTVTAAESLSLSAQLSHDIAGGFTLGTITFAPITITVAGVPVVIVPDLTLKLLANGTVSIGTITAGSTLTVGANVTTSDATVSAAPIYQLTTSFTPPTIEEPFSASIGPQAELGTHIDGLPGPFLTDSLLLPKLTVDPLHDPWWTLGGENILTLNYELSLLHHNFIDYSKTLSDIPFLVSHAQDPYQDVTITPSPATVAPGGQIQLRAQVAGVTSQAVTWHAPARGGTITAGGRYTAPATPGTYLVTATQPASGLKPAATGIIGVQVGHQPPGPPTSPAANSTSYGTATITWNPPADTGGGTITGYTVRAAPGGQTQTAPGTATTATMTGLTPGATYTFTVTATGGGGTSLPSPATSPVTIDNIGGSGGWTATEAPLPANAAADPSVNFTSVVCPGATCVAAGFYNDSGGNQQGLLETGSGTSWTAAESPLPANAGTNPTVYVNSVACESTSKCVIVGSYIDAAGNEHGLLVVGFGRSWQAIETSLPAKASTVAYSFLDSVTCPTSSTCFAVGSYVDKQNVEHTLLLTGSGTSWTAAHAPLPANAGTSDSGLLSVACSSVSTCMITGYYVDKSDGDQGLLLSRSGTSWTPVKAPKVANESTGLQIDPQTACVSSTCLSAGNYHDTSDNLQLSLFSGYGSSWTVTEAPLPASAVYNPGLNSAVCATASSCTAVGGYFDSPGGWYHVLVISGAESSWTATEAPIPSDGDFNGGGGIGLASSATCPSALDCTVVGFYLGASGKTSHGLLLEGHGSSWKATEAPLPPQGTGGDLFSVTCPSVSSCAAVGSYTNPSGSGQGLLLTKSA